MVCGSGQIDPERPRFWAAGVPIDGATARRGYRWADFRPYASGFHTILPPNAEICSGNNAGQTGVWSASSRHQGGAHVLMADGAGSSLRFHRAGDNRARWSGSITPSTRQDRKARPDCGEL